MRTGDAPRPLARHRTSGGFTYLWLLFVLALGGVALAALGEREQTRQQREREAELRFRGEAIAAAISRFAERTPIGHASLPEHLEELLNDRRFPKPQRHLRQVYADPFTGRADWELMLGPATVVNAPGAAKSTSGTRSTSPPARGIVGVRSSSARRLFGSRDGHDTAHDWVFMAVMTVPAAPAE